MDKKVIIGLPKRSRVFGPEERLKATVAMKEKAPKAKAI